MEGGWWPGSRVLYDAVVAYFLGLEWASESEIDADVATTYPVLVVTWPEIVIDFIALAGFWPRKQASAVEPLISAVSLFLKKTALAIRRRLALWPSYVVVVKRTTLLTRIGLAPAPGLRGRFNFRSGGMAQDILQRRAEELVGGQSRRQAQVFAWHPIIAPLEGGFEAPVV